MKYFLDTEFIEDGVTIDLISIGIVSDDGREFYACNRDAHFPMFCMDLKQLSIHKGSPKNPPDLEGEHNALADARWNRDLHSMLVGMPWK